jgi:predicted PurR-regulated permease PerM
MTDQGAGPGWKGWHGLARSGRPLTSEPPSGRRREIHDGSTPSPDRPGRSDATGGAGTPIDATSGTERLIERAIVLMLFGGLVLGVLLVLQPLATAILFGAILAIATWPLRSALLRLGLGHGAAAMLMFLAAVLLAGLPLLAAAPRLATALTEGALRLEALLATFPAGPPDWLARLPLAGDRLARGWRDLASAGADLQTALAPYASWIRQGALAVAGALADSVLQFVLALIVAATFWANGDAVAAVLRDVVRRLGGETAAEALEAAGASLRSVAYGVVGTACIQGILMALGAAIAGVPAPGLLGFLVMLLAISQIGAVLIPLVWGGGAWWLFHQGAGGWGMFLILWGAVLVSMSDNLIRPLLIRRGVAMPLTLVILGVFGGFLSFGFLGLFIGPALLAVAFTLLQAWRARASPPSA